MIASSRGGPASAATTSPTVSGPTVFPGYLGHEGSSPFRERDGKRWYVTGDLAEIDKEGFVHFRGRLKRFF